jgi:uncharacterized protein YjiS (DUF1127 family)
MSLAPAIAELRNPGGLHAFAGRVASALLRYEAWLDERAARRVLYSMNELALADIGLTHPDFVSPPEQGSAGSRSGSVAGTSRRGWRHVT